VWSRILSMPFLYRKKEFVFGEIQSVQYNNIVHVKCSETYNTYPVARHILSSCPEMGFSSFICIISMGLWVYWVYKDWQTDRQTNQLSELHNMSSLSVITCNLLTQFAIFTRESLKLNWHRQEKLNSWSPSDSCSVSIVHKSSRPDEQTLKGHQKLFFNLELIVMYTQISVNTTHKPQINSFYDMTSFLT
jgi:hypothetical protein